MSSPDEEETLNFRFEEYVRGFMEHDIEEAIKAKLNFLAALGLATYTEVLGKLQVGRTDSAATRLCFEAGWSLLGTWDGATSQWAYGKLRCGLVHRYFPPVEKEGNSGDGVVTVLLPGGEEIIVYGPNGERQGIAVVPWFDAWKRAWRELRTGMLASDEAVHRGLRVFRELLNEAPA